MKVGELAGATGLTVRTLHHYESIGLLRPSSRTAGGHRVYDADDVVRLYRICLLRSLGLPLADIGHAVDDPVWTLTASLERHLAALDERIIAAQRLRGRVAGLLAGDREELLDVIGDMSALDRPDFVHRRISLMVYADVAAAHAFLVEVFALGAGPVTRDSDGRAVHAEIVAGDGVIWLHPESEEHGLASPQRVGAVTGSMAVMVDDVDAHHAHAAARGAVVDYEPVDQPYGYREYSARDPEGGLWSFMKPLDPEEDA